MSEVYQAGETASPASEAGATAPYDAGSGPASADNAGSYPDAAPGDDFAGYSDADIDAFLAAEEQLPEPRTRQEAAAATWDDTTQPGDDDPRSFSGDPASEYDGDVAALLAAEDQLPEPRTRQEAAAATWDDTSTSQDGAPGTSTDGTSPSQPDTGMGPARNYTDLATEQRATHPKAAPRPASAETRTGRLPPWMVPGRQPGPWTTRKLSK